MSESKSTPKKASRFLMLPRILVGLPLFAFGTSQLADPSALREFVSTSRLPLGNAGLLIVLLLALIAGMLLLLGFCTRWASVLALVLLIPTIIATLQFMHDGIPTPRLALPSLITFAAGAAVLGLLGGGGASIDALRSSRVASSKREKKRVLILGGGFAGIYTAMHLEQLLRKRKDVELCLVSKENYFVFQPMLPEVISGNIGPHDTVSPLRRLAPRTRLYVREIEQINPDESTVTLAPSFENRSTVLPYDHLVIALGNVTDFRQVPGLHDHALPFKDLSDALQLRDHLIHILSDAANETQPEVRRQLLTFVIAGGGFSGVEVCAELNDFVREAGRKFYGVDPSEIRVILVHSRDRVLHNEMPESLALYAQKVLKHRGVEFLFNTRLSSATPGNAVLADGQHIPTRTLISTVPSSPNPIIESTNLPLDHDRIKTDLHTKVEGSANIWALGDCALIPNPRGGGFCPPTAQFATRQGAVCAKNILATIDGKPLKNFAFSELGKMAALGGHTAIARLFNRVNLHGFLAWVFWRGVYWMKLPGLDRKIRVGASWCLDLLLPTDIVQTKLDIRKGMVESHHEAGDFIFREGDTVNRVFLISKGSAELIQMNGTGEASVVARVSKGECFGRRDPARKAEEFGVRCAEDTIVLSMPQADFEPLSKMFPELRERDAQLIAKP